MNSALEPRRRTQPDPEIARELTPILVAEDNPADILLVEEALEEHGVRCKLLIARDGEKAIEFLDLIDSGAVPCPALIILDLNLPKNSGHEVLARIRARGKCTSTKVVILSSAPAGREKEEAARLGISRYIQKPTKLDEYMQIGAELKGILAEGR